MGKYEKLIFQILRGTSDANIAFSDLINLMQHFGFEMRIKVATTSFEEKGLKKSQIYKKMAIKQNHIKSDRYEK